MPKTSQKETEFQQLSNLQTQEHGPVDLGGAYIGPSQNRIINLAKELEIDTYNVYYNGKNVLDLTTVSEETHLIILRLLKNL